MENFYTTFLGNITAMRRILPYLLILISCVIANAREFAYTYQGQTIYYTVIDEEARTCMTRPYTHDEFICWHGGNQVEGKLVLPAHPMDGETEFTLTKIGSMSFFESPGLTEVSFPETIKTINGGAFSSCERLHRTDFTSLESMLSIRYSDAEFYSRSIFINGERLREISIPEGTESIGDYVFAGASEILKIIIPDGVRTIGSGSFRNCSGLAEITIPKSVVRIGEDAFIGCGGLKRALFEDIKTICQMEFESEGSNPLNIVEKIFMNDGEEITRLVIPETISAINKYAFTRCRNLTEILFPTTLKLIGENAFTYCTKLNELNFPIYLETIDKYAFQYCVGLTKLTIPQGIQAIRAGAFANCTNIVEINYNADNCACSGGIHSAFPKNLKKITFGENVTVIPDGINDWCVELTEVNMSNSIKKIGINAFRGCLKLHEITLPSSVEEIGELAFSDCTCLHKIEIPASITKIKARTFKGCWNLREVTLPETLSEIEDEAFADCYFMPEIKIPESLTKIGTNVFNECSGLETVYFNAIKCNGPVIESAESIAPLFPKWVENIIIGDKVTVIPDGMLANYKGQEVKLPASIKRISNYSFAGCTPLSLSELPVSIESIGDGAFMGCENIEEITIPSTITSLGNSVWAKCSRLRKVTIDTPLINLPAKIFEECRELEEIKLPQTLTVIENDAMLNCSGLKDIDIPESVTIIDERALYNCSSLTKLELPEGLTTIGRNAFNGCCAIEAIVIPDKVSHVGSNAFGNCKKLREVTFGGSEIEFEVSVFSGCNKIRRIYNKKVTPVTAPANMFSSECYERAWVYVPKNSIEEYQRYKPWSSFRYFYEIETLDVNEQEFFDGQSDYTRPIEVFTLSGVKVANDANNLKPGIYILRQGAKTIKTTIK